MALRGKRLEALNIVYSAVVMAIKKQKKKLRTKRTRRVLQIKLLQFKLSIDQLEHAETSVLKEIGLYILSLKSLWLSLDPKNHSEVLLIGKIA